MKFGVFYEIQLPTFHRDGDEGRMFRETLEHVELADGLGIQHMWAVEHVATRDQVSGGRVEFGTGDSSSRMETYGRFSHLPTADDYAIEATSADTAGALGLAEASMSGRSRPAGSNPV